MGVSQTWRVILIIFVSTASIHDVRLFDIYDVRSPFLSEVQAVPLSRFLPSSVYGRNKCASVIREHALIRRNAWGHQQVRYVLQWSLSGHQHVSSSYSQEDLSTDDYVSG